MAIRCWTAVDSLLRSASVTKRHMQPIKGNSSKKLDHLNTSLYEVELAIAQSKNKEPIVVHYASIRKTPIAETLLLLSHQRFYASKFEELKMGTDSLYLVLAEKDLEDSIRSGMKAEREQLRSNVCGDSFTADATGNFFSRIRWDKD